MQSVPVPDALQDAFNDIGFEAMNSRKRETFGLISAGRDDEALIDYLVRFELRPDLAEWLVGLVRQYGAEFQFDVVLDEAPPAVVSPQVVAPPPPAAPAYQVPEYDRKASRATSIRASISALLIVAFLLVGGYVKARNREIREINEDMVALQSAFQSGTFNSMGELKSEFGRDFQHVALENEAITKRFFRELEGVLDAMFDPKRLSSLKGIEKSKAEVVRSKAAIHLLTEDGSRLWNEFSEKHSGLIGESKSTIEKMLQNSLEAQRVSDRMLDSYAAYLDYMKANDPRWAPKGQLDEAKAKILADDLSKGYKDLLEYLGKDDALTSSAGDGGY